PSAALSKHEQIAARLAHALRGLELRPVLEHGGPKGRGPVGFERIEQRPDRRRAVGHQLPNVLERIPFEPPDPLLELELERVAKQLLQSLLAAPVVGGGPGGLFAGEGCVDSMWPLIWAPDRQAKAAATDACHLSGGELLIGCEDQAEARTDDVEG